MITQGADGAMWFTEALSRKIGRITMSGSITEPETVSDLPLFITLGPDTNLWVSLPFANIVAKMGSATGPTPPPQTVPTLSEWGMITSPFSWWDSPS